jgi:general stress protein YciG
VAPIDKKTVSEVMREMGRKGGKIGGKRRLETLTPEERREIARRAGLKGAAARWGQKTRKAATKTSKMAGKPKNRKAPQ